MALDFHKVARKWQRRWKIAKLFEPSPDNRPKFLLTMPYPYVNGLLHIGHTYTAMRVDAFARFKRMRGFNVLFPFGFHATGSPIDTAAKRVAENEPTQLNAMKLMGIKDEDLPKFKEPVHWIKTFSKEAEKDLTNYGMSIDWRRSFITTDLNPRYSKFIKWQFNTLKKKGLVVKGEHPVVWCPNENVPVGDHARSEGEGETPQEMVLIQFESDESILPCATFRPETVFGVTNIWVNPELEYAEAEVDGKHWILTVPALIKLKGQKHVVHDLRRLKGSELLDWKAKNPVTGAVVPILPASFVKEDVGTGVVMSVPSHAPFDYLALKELQDKGNERAKSVQPISLIEGEGIPPHFAIETCKAMGLKDTKDPKVEEATNAVYKKEFHVGKLGKVTGKYAGKSVQEAKPRLIEDLVNENKATLLYELANPVICRCLAKCHVKIVDDQWFVRYGDEQWKQQAAKALQQMKLYPEKVRSQFEYVIDWLKDWACTREFGLGTHLPWDQKWKIESLSDSTIYPAYYTLLPTLKKVPLGKINDKLFNYIFSGEGNSEELGIDKAHLASLKEEFNYWYPVDFRNSGKDLVQNHLAFYLFNHTAIFPEKFWPAGIGVNGYVTIQSKKMSKSKGIFKTLRDVVAAWSPDITRISILATGEEMSDVDWDDEMAKTMTAKLEQWYAFALESHDGHDEKKEIDKWMEHQLHVCIRDATKAMELTLFRTALQRGFFDLQRHLKWYTRRCAGKVNASLVQQIVEAQTLMLQPYTPHLCEEIWSKLGKQGFISTASWPIFDESKINPAIEHSEELMQSLLEDVGQVLKLAKIEKPTQITLFVAADWKVIIAKKVKDLLANTRNVGEIIKAVLPLAKDKAQEASQLIQKWVKDPSKLPGSVAHQEAEYQNLLDSVAFLKAELDCRFVEVVKEQDSQEPKAKQAMPGKPAILVK